ncbi:MAG: hypothetical protein JJU20_15235 [Opitutales bacterium]|nr:hypothetical protein [Opitutales bacterium]
MNDSGFQSIVILMGGEDPGNKWYFSIVDVVAILTESPNPQVYWRVMKKRLRDEGNESVTNCNALKMTAADGTQRPRKEIRQKNFHQNEFQIPARIQNQTTRKGCLQVTEIPLPGCRHNILDHYPKA